MSPATPTKPMRPLTLAADEALVARVDRFRALLALELPGSRPSRSCAARALLEAGLRVVEAEARS